MKDIFYEIIDEAVDGKIEVDGEKWPIGFNTFIYENGNLKKMNNNENNLSCLVIKDEDSFFALLDEYLELEISKNRKCLSFSNDDINTYKKFLISYLMVNASTEDFSNPMNYLRRTIDFLNDNSFSELNNGMLLALNGVLSGCKLRIKNSEQSVMMETPNKIEISIVKDGNLSLEYRLPSVSYGISDGVCYIYSLLNPKEKTNMSEDENKFSKKIWRVLYKVNSGVEQSEDEMTDISKVSPSAVFSLVTFLSLLKNKNITDVRGVPYLPVRYLSRDMMAKEKTGERRDELLERNLMIQKNVTDKFIRTFFRAAYHLDDSEVVLMPYEMDECLHFRIGSNMKTDNVLLNEAVESTKGR